MARTGRALVTLPTRRDGLEAVGLSVVMAVLVAAVGFSTGLLRVDPQPVRAGELLLMLLAPAFCEELVFRGLLIPDRAETLRPFLPMAVGVSIFVLWHVFEGLVTLPGAHDLFLRTDFLAIAGVIGLTCAISRWRSGSIWPAVGIHWTAVVAWRLWLGGPALATLAPQ